MADKPVTREEKYLAYLTGDYTGEIPKPITRKEKYLYELCLKGIGGEISPEEIKNAVNEYLEKNPVKPGATTEQAQQIEQNKTNIASLKEDIDNIISPNLFNPAVAKENVAISSGDGSEMNGFSGWETTDYIPVSKGEVLYFSSNNEPTTYATGAFYDNNKNRVDSFGNPNNNNNIAVTSDGYARFSFGSKKEKLQIEKGSRTTYVPYGELKVKAEVDNIKEDVTNIKVDVTKIRTEVTKIQEDHTNLFNKDTVTKGAVLTENGYFDSNFSGWDSSDYIPVKPGMTLYFSSNELPIGVASTGAYFDADKKYLSGVNNEPTVLTVPDGAYYLRFSKNGGLGDTLNTLKIEQYGITKFTPYGELYVTVTELALPSSILPKWKGLKILTLGDSITAMGGVNGWTYWIKQFLLADKVVNVSVAGSTWQDKVANQVYDGNPQPSTNGNVMGNQVQKVLNAKANGDADYQDFDVITFSFGTNDSVDFSLQTKESVESQFIANYAQNNFTVVPIDNVNRQTLAGAMRYGFQKLHEAYPNAAIFMCTPTQECYETFDSIYQKGDFINFVADRLGAETIDTRRCGIRNIYESQTTIDYDHPDQSGVAPIQTDLLDGIHTNENGAKKIAKYNAREIMKYFTIN
jgi:lysophospholipase L1-like esterase